MLQRAPFGDSINSIMGGLNKTPVKGQLYQDKSNSMLINGLSNYELVSNQSLYMQNLQLREEFTQYRHETSEKIKDLETKLLNQ